MDVDERILKVFRDFHERKIDSLTLFVEGFGGFFFKRVKDGFVVGYEDKKKRFGLDDHVTVFYGQRGLEGLHRKISDKTTDVYVRPEVTYMESSGGINRMLQDLERRGNVNLLTKMIVTLVYKSLGTAFREGQTMAKRATLLNDSEALKKGVFGLHVFVLGLAFSRGCFCKSMAATSFYSGG